MREPRGNPQHVVILLGERRSHPTPERRRAAPDIDSDIKHRPSDDPNQLALRLLDLVVQAAQNVARRAAVIVLYELHVQPGGGEFTLLPGLEEITTRVAEHPRADQDDV